MPTLRTRLLSPASPDEVTWIHDAVVVFEDGQLTHVGPYDGRPVDEDLRPAVLLPGFVDAHVHFPQTRIVGAATGPLLQWLSRSTFPEEKRFADTAHAAAVAEVFVRQLASCGTTLAFVYGSVHHSAAEQLFLALANGGLRAIAGPVLMDEGGPDALMIPYDKALDQLESLVEAWHGHDGRLEVAAIPRFGLSCSMQMMAGAASLARRHRLWCSTHLSENRQEVAATCERFDAPDYLEVYERAGLVNPKSVFAHCIHLHPEEWDRFQRHGATVAHCPDSNFFLGSGNMPIAEVRKRHIPLAVGTDVAAGRSFSVRRILSSAFDNGLATGVRLDPRQLLWWGTRGGALALQHHHTGSLEEGNQADMVLLDVPPWAEDADQVLASVLFDHDAPRARRTWVAGQVVWDRSAWGVGPIWGSPT